jgi:hypothetical protein
MSLENERTSYKMWKEKDGGGEKDPKWRLKRKKGCMFVRFQSIADSMSPFSIFKILQFPND